MVCSHLQSSLLLGIHWVPVIDQVTVQGTLDPSSFHSSKEKLSTPGLDCLNWLESGRKRNLFRRPLQQHFTPCSVYPEARDRLADKFGACKSPNDVLRLLRPLPLLLLTVSEMSTIFSYLKIGPPLNGSGTFRQMTWKRIVCLWIEKNTRLISRSRFLFFGSGCSIAVRVPAHQSDGLLVFSSSSILSLPTSLYFNLEWSIPDIWVGWCEPYDWFDQPRYYDSDWSSVLSLEIFFWQILFTLNLVHFTSMYL